MSRTYEYRSGLASQISAFIAEKRACGCKYEKEAKTFQTLDRFLVEQGTTVYNRFRDALWHCGIAHKGRGYGPRVHDLRHTFAVRSMQKLKKSKSDIVTTLPYLSAYLGHCNMSATQIYLHLTAECYPEFIQKQCDYLGDTIPTWEAPNENC